MKIIQGEREKILDFNGKKSVTGVLYGDYYLIFKSKEDYEQKVAEKERATELRKYINDNLDNLSLEKLEALKQMVDTNLAQ